MPDHVRAVLDANRENVRRLVAQGAGQALDRILRAAREDLAKRLERETKAGLEERWTGVQTATTKHAVDDAIRALRKEFGKHLETTAIEAAKGGIKGTLDVLRTAEERFEGVLRPLALDTALRFDHALHGLKSSMLRQHVSSVARYGSKLTGEIEKTMAMGVLAQKTQHQVISDVQGVIGKERYWAERIVRTETLHAWNRGAQATAEIEQAEDFPDLKRIILATFDRRTASDSIFVSGEIRGINEEFTDGAGRVYLFPPARPNDREVVVAWRPGWPLEKVMHPKPEAERLKAAVDAGGGAELVEHVSLNPSGGFLSLPDARRLPPPPPPPKDHGPTFRGGFRRTFSEELAVSDLAKYRTAVERAMGDAGLTAYLKKNPIEAIHFRTSLARPGAKGPGPSGKFNNGQRALYLRVKRGESTYGKPFVPGELHSISQAGATKMEAIQRTATHEVAHHIHDSRGGPENRKIDKIVNAAYTNPKSKPITVYAAKSAPEYFAESFAAYRFHRDELLKYDPVGHAMVERVLRAKGIPTAAAESIKPTRSIQSGPTRADIANNLRQKLEVMDERGIRQGTRRILEQHGYSSFDVMLERADKNAFGTSESLNGGLFAAQHDWDGKIYVSHKTLSNAKNDLAGLAHGKALTPDGRRLGGGLNVLLHEEIHGASPMTYKAYRNHGAVIEEVITELGARHVTRELFQDKTLWAATERGWERNEPYPAGLAYGDHINTVATAIRDSGVSNADAVKKLEHAVVRCRQNLTERHVTDTPDEHLDQFLSHLDVTPEQRRAIRQKIVQYGATQ